jgi:hypothetical protein
LELIRQSDAYTGSAGSADEDLSGWIQTCLPFNISNHEPTKTDPVPCSSPEV